MNRQKRNINGKSGGVSWNNSLNGPAHDLPVDKKDSALFESFGEYMKGRLDLEEVRNDPSLKGIKDDVRDLITDFCAKSAKHKYDENFIRNSFGGSDKELAEEIKNIKFEIHKSNVEDISAEWVKEWHENRKKRYTRDPKKDEIRDFISSSLESDSQKLDISEPEVKSAETTRKGVNRTLLVSYISLSAAAVIGVLIIISTLLPSSDPQKLYSSFYKPFDVISSLTRGGNLNVPDKYSVSVEKYRLGDYKAASAGFTNLLLNDSSSIAARFFLGLSQLGVANYDQAIIQLNRVSSSSGAYQKEASWYLSLAYLKTGEKEKAAICLNTLAQSSGFYSERSRKILRRLK